MAGAYEIFVAGLRETLYGNATAQATRTLEVVPAAHGSRSGTVGGAVMVLDEVLSARAVDALVARSALGHGLRDDVLREPLQVADLVVERLGVLRP